MEFGTKEFDDIVDSFEKAHFPRGGLEREPREFWKKGWVFSDGEWNDKYLFFRKGYALGRSVYLDEGGALRDELATATKDLRDIDRALCKSFGHDATAGVGSVDTLPQAVRRVLAQVQADLARKDELIAALENMIVAYERVLAGYVKMNITLMGSLEDSLNELDVLADALVAARTRLAEVEGSCKPTVDDCPAHQPKAHDPA